MSRLMPRLHQLLIFYVFITTVAGSGALLSTLILGWYSASLGGGSNLTGETYYPTMIQLWGSQAGSPYSLVTSYSAVEQGSIGILYLAVAGLVVAGGLTGATTAYLMWRGADRTPRRFVTALLVATTLLALAGPVAVAFTQPTIVCSDSVVVTTPFEVAFPNNTSGAKLPCGWDMATSSGGPNYSLEWGISAGPQSSFYGTSNETGQAFSWGPGFGWYLAIAATALLALGAVVYSRADRSSGTSREKHGSEAGNTGPPRVG
jgi:hypothetical protein